MSNSEYDSNEQLQTLGHVEMIALVAENWDMLQDVRGKTFRVKQLDTHIGPITKLRKHNIIEIVEEYSGYGEVNDYRITQFGDDVIELVYWTDNDEIPDTDQIPAIRNNRETIDKLPGKAGIEFEAGDYEISAPAVKSLYENRMLERVEQRPHDPDIWKTTEELVNIKKWL